MGNCGHILQIVQVVLFNVLERARSSYMEFFSLLFNIHDIAVRVSIVLFIMCLVCDVIICGHVSGAILHAYL